MAQPLMADPATVLKPESITDAMKPDVMPAPGPAGMTPASPIAPVPAAAAMQTDVPATAPASATSLGAGVMPPALPAEGPLAGKAFLDPNVAPKVPDGAPRPLAMTEHVVNPDGSTSNEISVTVQDKSLNGGKPTLLPSLWVVNGQPTRVNEDQAVAFAKQSGLRFKSFDTLDQAEKFATDRETKWQTTKSEDAGKVEPLWSQSGGDKVEPVEVMSKPSTGIIHLTPELIQRVLSDPQIIARLKEINRPKSDPRLEALPDLQNAQHGAGAIDKK